MNFWMLSQIVLDLFLVFAVAGIWIKRATAPKDDPKLSRGLQILQTKISVLEDLSDRTETQVHQLTSLMETKVKEIQAKILDADKHLQQLEIARTKSLEVAKIFQDRIPHSEILERQNTMKYVKAARMAHQGHSVEEIASVVDLSRGEIEFIAKVNRERLQFSEEDLPEWTKEAEHRDEPNSELMNSGPTTVQPQMLMKTQDSISSPMSELGNKFRQAIQNANSQSDLNSATVKSIAKPEVAQNAQVHKPTSIEVKMSQAEPSGGWNVKGDFIEVRKVVFPRVNSNRVNK